MLSSAKLLVSAPVEFETLTLPAIAARSIFPVTVNQPAKRKMLCQLADREIRRHLGLNHAGLDHQGIDVVKLFDPADLAT